MIPAIVFPDASELVIDALSDVLGVGVSGSVPKPRPTTFVTVIRTGGVKANSVTDGAQLTIDSWSDTAPAAMSLAQNVRSVMSDLAGQRLDGVQCYTVTELSGPVVLPDPLSNSPRVRQSFTVLLRGTAQTS